MSCFSWGLSLHWVIENVYSFDINSFPSRCRLLVAGVLADRSPAELHMFRNYDPPGVDYGKLSAESGFAPLPRPNGAFSTCRVNNCRGLSWKKIIVLLVFYTRWHLTLSCAFFVDYLNDDELGTLIADICTR